jgi:tetratricopeptide (TPR) repeat protein
MRRDELVEGLNKGYEFTHDHLRQVLFALGALGAIGLLWLGYRTWAGSRQETAAVALAEAQRVYTAPLVGEAGADAPGALSFPTAEARRERAVELFTALRRDHRGAAGAAAAIYLARIALEQGNAAEAERLWTAALEEDPDGMLAAPVQLDLLRLQRTQGEGEEALRALEAMLRDDRRRLPEDVVLYELGATLRGLGRGGEARAYLQRIVEEFPRSSYRSAAQQELASLPPAPAPAP